MSKLNVKDTTTSVESDESLCEPSKLQGKVPLHPKQDWDQRQTSAQKRLKPENEEDSDDDSTFKAPPKKISFGISQKSSQPAAKHANKIGFGGFKMGIQKTAPKTSVTSTVFESGLKSEKKFQSKPKVAAAFGDDDDDEEEEEEMPAEAKMRMKNIGRDTPTSAGPNSYGKSRMGFCDSKNIYERKLKEGQEKQRSD